MLKTARREGQESVGNFPSTQKPSVNHLYCLSYCMEENYDVISTFKATKRCKRSTYKKLKLSAWGRKHGALTVVTYFCHGCFFLKKGIHCVSISDPPDPKQDAAGLTSEAPDAALCENRLRVRLPLPRAQVQSCDNMRGQQD